MVEATELIPGLFIGSTPPVGSDLAHEGIDTVVLCALEYQPSSQNFPGLRSVIHAPLDDSQITPAERDTALLAAMETADRYLRGEQILITCMQGRNRSGLVAALTIALIWCVPPIVAARHVRKTRVAPGGFPALTNPSFVAFLSKLGPLC